MEAAPVFDPQDSAFRYWLAAMLTAKKVTDDKVPETVTTEVMRWRRHRLNDKFAVDDPGANAEVVTWVRGPLATWSGLFWKMFEAEGKLDDALNLIGGMTLTAEEQALLAAARAFQLPMKHNEVKIIAAKIKLFVLTQQNKTPGGSLEKTETSWAPTGAWTGGGQKSLAGKMMTHNIVVSRGLTSARDVLLAVLFELENVKRWKEYEDLVKDGRFSDKAIAEFGAFKGNQQTLRTAYGAADQKALCVSLGVPDRLLEQVKPGGVVPVYEAAVLRDETARNALWWYQTELWSEDKRCGTWIHSPHGGGMPASTTLYAK